MRLNVCTLTGALALAALFAAPASAQNLAQEVTSGARAPQNVRATVGVEGAKILRSDAAARNAGVYSLIPPNWMFRPQWSQEIYLLAVDQRSSGPGSVSITVERKRAFDVGFFSLHYMQATVKRLVPAPGTVGTPSAIRPYTLVKIPRTDEVIQIRVRTEQMAAPAPTPPLPGPAPLLFTGVVRQLTTQPSISVVGPGPAPTLHRSTEQVDVRADGQVVISRWSSPGLTGIPPLTGTASQAELQQLNQALRRARLNGIPSQLGGAGFPQFSLTGLGLPAGDKTIVGVRGAEGSFKPRLDGVHAVLDAIRNRLMLAPPPAPAPRLSFNSIARTQRFPHQRRRFALQVDGAGKATLTIKRRNRPRRTFQGKLTDDEARRLSRAVRRSRLRQLPSDLPVWHVAPGNTFELAVDAKRPRNSNTVRGEVGDYGPYAGAVQPIMAVLDEITQRLRAAGPVSIGGGSLTGGLSGTNNP